MDKITNYNLLESEGKEQIDDMVSLVLTTPATIRRILNPIDSLTRRVEALEKEVKRLNDYITTRPPFGT